MFPQLPSTTLFPYTTLFRSIDRVGTRRLDIRLAPEFERWLDTPYRAVDQRQRAVRIPGPHYEVHPRPDLQRVRQVDLRRELVAWAILPHVGDDTDDRQRNRLPKVGAPL